MPALGTSRSARARGGEEQRCRNRRRGKTKAQVAVDRSILVIICHLLSDPAARYADLSYGYGYGYSVITSQDLVQRPAKKSR
jgi:hypothetical protein